MLAGLGRMHKCIGLRIAAHVDRLADHFLRAVFRVIDGFGDAEVLHLRVGKHLVDGVDRAARHARFVH